MAASPLSLSWPQVRAWRLHRQYLDQRAPRKELLDVVAKLGGVQAQLMSSAELALWARVADLETDAISRALWEKRSLVKTWAMRGTLHLLLASELDMWQSVPQLDRRYLRPAWQRYYGITPEDLDRLTDAVGSVLDGRLLNREELAAEVSQTLDSKRLGELLLHSWGAMLKPAAFRCRLCFAPSSGQNVRFTHPDSWLGKRSPIEQSDAEHEVVRRFLGAYGPATREAFGIWLGVPPSRAGKLIAALGEQVTQVDVEGVPAWALTAEVEALASSLPPGAVRLVPAFDQYVIGTSKYPDGFLPGPFKSRVSRPQGWLSPVLLIDGRMDGVWRHERKSNRLVVQIEPFVAIPAWAKTAAEIEAELLASFMERRLELSWL